MLKNRRLLTTYVTECAQCAHYKRKMETGKDYPTHMNHVCENLGKTIFRHVLDGANDERIYKQRMALDRFFAQDCPLPFADEEAGQEKKKGGPSNE